MRAAALTESFHIYFKLTKPNVWWLLVFVGVGGFLAGSGGNINVTNLAVAVLSLILGSAGAESVANYLERDIDSLMQRTRRRPLPQGLISPPEKALIFGLILTAASLVITALLLNALAFLTMLIGILDYLLVYVILTKRRTAWNIILGSPAGAAPVMVGYSAARGFLDLTAVVLSSLVIFWIPSHVWSLALRYREDYVRAGIPMMTTILPERTAVRVLAFTSILLFASSLTLPLLNPKYFTTLYLSTILILGAALMLLSMNVIINPIKRNAWLLFKFTSPYLAVVFSVVMLESLNLF